MYRSRFAVLDNPGPIAFAHRGGAAEKPENTWASFTHALDLGYRYMETDAHATKDDVVVAIHDPDLSRVAGRPAMVRDLTWRELSEVKLEGDERVPRLDELLSVWPDVRWNIDAKHDSVVQPLAELIRACGVIDRVCVTSFSDRRLHHLQQDLGDGLCTALGPAATAALRAASIPPQAAGRFATDRFSRYGAAQVPTRYRAIPIVEPKLVSFAHRAGLQVHVWTVDSAGEMDRLLDLGVDGIMTDRPTVLKAVMERRGSWTPATD